MAALFGTRDIVWAATVCLLLNLVIYYRPLWGARGFVRDQADAGFRIVYDGHRFVSGQPIVSPLKGGTQVDPLKAPVLRQRVNIEAEQVSWNGRSAEFVVRHTIVLSGSAIDDDDASYDAHVKLTREGGRWQYTLFEVRDRGEVSDFDARNPFAVAAERASDGS